MNNKLFPDFENIINIGEIPTSFENAFTYLEQVLLLRKWITKLAEVLEIEDTKINKNTEDINILKSYEHITKIKTNPLLLYEQTTGGLFIASLDATQINPEKELIVRADTRGINNIGLKDKSLIFINVSIDEKAKSKVITLFSPNGDGYAYAISKINTETNEITGKVGHFTVENYLEFVNSVHEYMTATNQTIDNIKNSLNILNSYGHIEKINTEFNLYNATSGIYMAESTLQIKTTPTENDTQNTFNVFKGSIINVIEDAESDRAKKLISCTIVSGSEIKYGYSSVNKQTGEFIEGGYQYFNYNDLEDRINTLENNPYTLPKATNETLGGIKVGNGLSIDEDGTLNNTGSNPIIFSISQDDTAENKLNIIKAFLNEYNNRNDVSCEYVLTGGARYAFENLLVKSSSEWHLIFSLLNNDFVTTSTNNKYIERSIYDLKLIVSNNEVTALETESLRNTGLPSIDTINNINGIDLSDYQFIKNPFNNKTYLNYKNITVFEDESGNISISEDTMKNNIKEWFINTRKSPNQRLNGGIDTCPYFNVTLSYTKGTTSASRDRYDSACYPIYYKLYTSYSNYYQLIVLYPFYNDNYELKYYQLIGYIDDTGSEVTVPEVQISIIAPTSSDTKYYILTENTTNSLPMLKEMYEMIKVNKIPDAIYMKGNYRYVFAGTNNLFSQPNKIDIMFMQINIDKTNNVKLVNYRCSLQDGSIISVDDFKEKTLTIPPLTHKFSFNFLFTDDSENSSSNYDSNSYLITGISKSFDVNEIYGELMVKYSETVSGSTYSSVCSADSLKYMLNNVSGIDYSFRKLNDGTTELTLFIRRTDSTQPFVSPVGIKIENIFINGYFINGTEDVSKSISITKN